MAVFVVFALIVIRIKGFTFIDLQLVVMIIAVSFYFDMIFCKWLNYYAYVVNHDLKAFYSLVFCVIGYPALGIIFIKMIPSSKGKIILYILGNSAALTILELLTVPLGIVLYDKWRIIPYSPLIYVLSYTWTYYYYQILKQYIGIKAKQ